MHCLSKVLGAIKGYIERHEGAPLGHALQISTLHLHMRQTERVHRHQSGLVLTQKPRAHLGPHGHALPRMLHGVRRGPLQTRQRGEGGVRAVLQQVLQDLAVVQRSAAVAHLERRLVQREGSLHGLAQRRFADHQGQGFGLVLRAGALKAMPAFNIVFSIRQIRRDPLLGFRAVRTVAWR